MYAPPSAASGGPRASAADRELRKYFDLVNQVFEIEKKADALREPNSLHRNVSRLKSWLETELSGSAPDGQPVGFSLTYHNPIGEPYNETRTHYEVSIAGDSTENLVIVEVIKPVIFLAVAGYPKQMVQKAVVVARAREEAFAASTELPTATPATEPAPKPTPESDNPVTQA